jgi:uncharacterized integral membrane protein
MDNPTGPPVETWPLDDVSWAVALGRLNAIDALAQQLDESEPTSWSAVASAPMPPSAPLPLLVAETPPTRRPSELVAPRTVPSNSSAAPQSSAQAIPSTRELTAGEAGVLRRSGVAMVVAGLLYALTLSVPFATHQAAAFHFTGTDWYVGVIAMGMVLSGLLLLFPRSCVIGAGSGFAVMAIVAAGYVGELADLMTPLRAYGPGFWLTGVVVIVGLIAMWKALWVLRISGRIRFRGGQASPGWVAGAGVFGLLAAIGMGLPHRIETVTSFRGAQGYVSLGSATLRGGLDQAYWSAILSGLLIVVIVLVFPIFASMMRDGWLATGLIAGTVIGLVASVAELATEMGAIVPLGYTSAQIDDYHLTATVSPAIGFYLLVVGGVGLCVLALVRGVDAARSS